MRFAIWAGERPVYCQMMETTGMLIFGKISVGVLSTARGPRIINRSARTTQVYGRRNARRTIHISFQLLLTTSGSNADEDGVSMFGCGDRDPGRYARGSSQRAQETKAPGGRMRDLLS